MLSMCWALAQTLPLARFGKATFVAKKAASPSGVVGAVAWASSASSGPR